MARPSFLCDHDLNEAIYDGVRRQEPVIEITKVRELGLQEASDPEVLEYAAQHGLIVVSHDANTMTAHAYDRITQGEKMPGLFVVQQKSPIGPVVNNLVLIWSATDLEVTVGAGGAGKTFNIQLSTLNVQLLVVPVLVGMTDARLTFK